MLQNLGTTEIIIIGLVLLVFFGGKQLSKMAGELGETERELKKVKKQYTKAVDISKEDVSDDDLDDEDEEKSKESVKTKGGGS